MLIVNSLQKRYGTQNAVSDVSFRIEQGEIVGFLGVNGAGKSTTMRMIVGAIDPDGGSIEVCGLDRVAQPIESKRMIGYLAENNPLYGDMYVREYLLFVARMFSNQESELRVESVIDRVGLRQEAHKKIKALSKGFKQRVGLAQALVHQPSILILDEPTTGLDPNQILEIRSLIRQEAKGRVVLLSSHILQEIEAICSRVIIIHLGKLVADFAIEELREATKDRFVIEVEFARSVERTVIESLDGVEHCEMGIDGTQFKLSVSNDIRERIFDYSVKTSNSIKGLSIKMLSLEDLFSQLTRAK